MAEYEIKNGVGIIPEGTTEIKMYAFRDCEELSSVLIPDSVQEIRDSAFSSCLGLKSIVIPNSVTKIGSDVFSNCKNLTSVVLSNSLTEIGYDAFFGCSNLSSVVVPASVTKIIGNPFERCSALTNISVDENNKVYDSRENCNAIIETASNKLIGGCSATVIPDTVTEIGANAFQGSSLTSIIVPSSVTKVEDFAFADCKELTDVFLPKSVKSLGQLAFKECPNLKSFTILGPVKKLEKTFWLTDPEHPFGYPLGHENMETITLGTGIKVLTAIYRCPNLKAIYVPAKKGDYYRELLSPQVHHLIVELPAEKKAKK